MIFIRNFIEKKNETGRNSKVVTLDQGIVKKVVGKITRMKLDHILLKFKGQF